MNYLDDHNRRHQVSKGDGVIGFLLDCCANDFKRRMILLAGIHFMKACDGAEGEEGEKVKITMARFAPTWRRFGGDFLSTFYLRGGGVAGVVSVILSFL